MIKLYLFNGEYLIFEDTEMNAQIVAEQVFNIEVDNYREVNGENYIFYVMKDDDESGERLAYWTIYPAFDEDVIIIEKAKNVCAKINSIIFDDYIEDCLQAREEEFRCQNS